MDKFMRRLEHDAQKQQKRGIEEKKRGKKPSGAKGKADKEGDRKRPRPQDKGPRGPSKGGQPQKMRRSPEGAGKSGAERGEGAERKGAAGASKVPKKVTKRERELARTYGEIVVKAKVRPRRPRPARRGAFDRR